MHVFLVSRVLTSFLAMALMFVVCSGSYAQRVAVPRAEKPTVLVLATSHLHNPGRDVMNIQWDDVLAEKRQKEIREFVELLKKFKPTKIAVEVPFGSVKTDEEYRRYLRGEYELTRNEIDQIAYRLAKELGHSKVYPVDAAGPFEIGGVFEFAAENDQQQIINRAMEIAKKQVGEANALVKTVDITEFHRAINDQRTIDEGHQAYLSMLRIGRGENYPGAELVADWYKRNLKIFANITRITESNDERILVLIGSGHAKLLQQFIEDSGEYKLEKAARYF